MLIILQVLMVFSIYVSKLMQAFFIIIIILIFFGLFNQLIYCYFLFICKFNYKLLNYNSTFIYDFTVVFCSLQNK